MHARRKMLKTSRIKNLECLRVEVPQDILSRCDKCHQIDSCRKCQDSLNATTLVVNMRVDCDPYCDICDDSWHGCEDCWAADRHFCGICYAVTCSGCGTLASGGCDPDCDPGKGWICGPCTAEAPERPICGYCRYRPCVWCAYDKGGNVGGWDGWQDSGYRICESCCGNTGSPEKYYGDSDDDGEESLDRYSSDDMLCEEISVFTAFFRVCFPL